MADCELRDLRQHPAVPLRGLNVLPQYSLPSAETNPQGLRPFCHISVNRRDLHSLPARQPARRLGLVPARGDLGTGDGRDSVQGMVCGACSYPVHGDISSDGLARACSSQADAYAGSDEWTPLVAGRRDALHGWCGILRVEETAVQPRHLAWLRVGWKYLPLFCGALLGNPSNEGPIDILLTKGG